MIQTSSFNLSPCCQLFHKGLMLLVETAATSVSDELWTFTIIGSVRNNN